MFILSPSLVQRAHSWAAFKSIQAARIFTLQLNESNDTYDIWGYDGPEAHVCTIWLGTVPDGIILSGYSQVQNDADKLDFETNYKEGANRPSRTDFPASTTILTNVPAEATSTLLLAANLFRLSVVIFNDSNKSLFLKYGTGASSTSFTYKVPAGGTYEMPARPYIGVIYGCWSAAQGIARVTEMT